MDESQRWEDVYGYIITEYAIDTNTYRVVFHVERGGYFSGYYMDEDILTEKELPMYRFVLDQIVKDLEEVPVG